MGTFEKLGILVIVVIIVMILAVAIYQWGGTSPIPVGDAGAAGMPDPLTIKLLEDLGDEESPPQPRPAGEVGDDTWPGGIPRSYTIRKNDKVWVLVVRRWRLSDSFVAAITAANPRADMKRLLPGDRLVIPDPSAYRRGGKGEERALPKSGARSYEVKLGDTLESIAYMHLGSRSRWHDILKLNPGLNPKRMMEGQEIDLPLK